MDEIWIIGDVFLSFAAEHMQKIQQTKKNQRLKQYFIYENFDVKFSHVPIMEECNVLARLRKALSDLLNRTKKLPRIILVVIDKDFTKLGASTEAYDKVLNWYMVEILAVIQECKNQILENCFRKSEPKVVFAKPVPKYELIDVDNINREMRRLFNGSLEKCVKKFRYFYAFNVDDIIPNDASLFELLVGSLTLKGCEVFWQCVDTAIKKIDTGMVKHRKHPNQQKTRDNKDPADSPKTVAPKAQHTATQSAAWEANFNYQSNPKRGKTQWRHKPKHAPNLFTRVNRVILNTNQAWASLYRIFMISSTI